MDVLKKQAKSFLHIAILMMSSLTLSAQDSHSIQINSGYVSPLNSQDGISISVQYNYKLNKNLFLYANAGYKLWDKNKLVYLLNRRIGGGYGQAYFFTYNKDEHKLIPLMLGGRMNFYTNKLFVSFLKFEIGYSSLSYNVYEQRTTYDEETGDINAYYPILYTRKSIRENLFALGVGGGFFIPVNKTIGLVISYKLSSYLNEKYHGLFSTNGTYHSLTAGIDINI
ncbi:MAG: hypothetical protein K9J16_16030 [Melioribacteraceae bacterium]|nr:hypothetical protein [Melioribacteraceae bacterium]MCF8356143.1 hypothetical protein [Melioribacteraceae bacterium]MCF8395491.1 hypothetical protein [Melioribacteraceae bacterium]MCF8420831.1 hypothetical protein [Melioribacteraceae bacterium]